MRRMKIPTPWFVATLRRRLRMPVFGEPLWRAILRTPRGLVQQTFQAMESAIDASRQTIRAQILSREAAAAPNSAADASGTGVSTTPTPSPVVARSDAGTPPPVAPASTAVSPPATYSVADALSDIRSYDDACSIKGGLAKLSAAVLCFITLVTPASWKCLSASVRQLHASSSFAM
jgi:hypothetical protein